MYSGVLPKIHPQNYWRVFGVWDTAFKWETYYAVVEKRWMIKWTDYIPRVEMWIVGII